MYTRTWDKTFATNTGHHENGDEFTISSSYSYSNEKDPGTELSCIIDTPSQPEVPQEPEPEPTSTVQPTTTPAYPTTTKAYPTTTLTTVTTTPTPTPQPPKDDIECFKARSWSYSNKHLNGRWLDAKDKLAAKWVTSEHSASVFYLDKSHHFRAAKTGTYAFCDAYGKDPWGRVDFNLPGHPQNKHDPQIDGCKIVTKKAHGYQVQFLFCGAYQTFRSKGYELTWGAKHPDHADAIFVEVVKTKCPSKGYW